MDLKVFKRRTCSAIFIDQNVRESRSSATASWLITMTLTKLLVVCLIALPLLVALRLVLPYPSSGRNVGSAYARSLGKGSHNGTSVGKKDGYIQSPEVAKYKDKLLGGLLSPGFHESSCLSRYQSSLYRKASPYKPSPYLLSRLRNYEDLHRRCGPNSNPYRRALNELMFGQNITTSRETECNYVVWISYSGLGNKILTVASTFLYAILTNRVMLIDPRQDMSNLFCEPFPESSWFLPKEFPLINKFDLFGQKSSDSFGNMLKNNILNSSAESQTSYLYLHLPHDYDDYDKLFFCDQEQPLLSKVPWLILKSNQYFVPSLFLMPGFEQQLNMLFPHKTTVFHHLGRYLFHPSNQVWGLITRYYQAYLAKADEKIGIQIRVFDGSVGPSQYVTDQILSCTLNQKLLPQVDEQKFIVPPLSGNPKQKAVLLTSLSNGYYEILRNMYWQNPTVTGDLIGIYQPSHEEFQQTEKQSHNRKAWAEIYLLSLTDVLVTSAWSTFGYVAHGLGGLRPWVLYKLDENNLTVPDPPCAQLMSMEPCFHAPPYYDCKAKTGVDTGKLVPYVRHCEDISWGVKIVDTHFDI
ncbi:hypothetical protein L6164_020829 [Bauhinia variegata]|uniref:Uncharacterized protein n=1 Tax=Bauhinia variegata TaxID=167791 RepID=A0ACB9MWJ7_BAUVA|nr:hypothetical protein L6164_020829 [Bauhinia variegata]